jgi:TldD protein
MATDVFAAAGVRADEYAEVRTERNRILDLVWRGRAAEAAILSHEDGVCARVYSPAGWSFASTCAEDPAVVLRRARAQAGLVNAGRRAFTPGPAVTLNLEPTTDGEAAGTAARAETVGLDAKTELLSAYHAAALRAHSSVAGALLYYRESHRRVRLRTSHGCDVWYAACDVTLQLTVYAADGTDTATAALSLGSGGDLGPLHDLDADVARTAAMAVDLLRAPPVQPGAYDVICDGPLAGAWAHETVGHLAEADHPAVDELAAAFAPGAVVGPPALTIVDGPGSPGARGHVPVDDEGVMGTDVVLVDRGRATGARLHSAQTATAAGQRPTGNARAVDYRHAPLPRLRTIAIAAGPDSLTEMVASTRRGLLAAGFYGGQTDRISFTFSPGHCRTIEDGKIGGLVRGAVLSGGIVSALGQVDRVGGEVWRGDTSASCGKQGQWPLPVSAWAPPIRLRGLYVRVG